MNKHAQKIEELIEEHQGTMSTIGLVKELEVNLTTQEVVTHINALNAMIEKGHIRQFKLGNKYYLELMVTCDGCNNSFPEDEFFRNHGCCQMCYFL